MTLKAKSRTFVLHPQLKNDTFFISDLKLCRVLLLNNRHFPWLILVPKIAGAHELVDLSQAKRAMLMEEIATVSKIMQRLFSPDKLNVAALGNQVEQLHIHVIARFKADSAWPNPTFGNKSTPYENPKQVIESLRQAIG